MSRKNPNNAPTVWWRYRSSTSVISLLLSTGLLEFWECQRGVHHLFKRSVAHIRTLGVDISHGLHRFRISVRHEMSLSSESLPKLAPAIPSIRDNKTSTII